MHYKPQRAVCYKPLQNTAAYRNTDNGKIAPSSLKCNNTELKRWLWKPCQREDWDTHLPSPWAFIGAGGTAHAGKRDAGVASWISLICNSNSRISWWDHKHCSIAPFSPPLWGKDTSQVMPLEMALNMCKSIRVGKPQSLSRNQPQHRFKHQVYQAASCTAVFLTTVPGRHCSSVCTAALKELTVENTRSKSPFQIPSS